MNWTKAMVVCSVLFAACTALLTLRHIQRSYAVQPFPATHTEMPQPTPEQTYVRLLETEVRQLLSGNCAMIDETRKLPEPIKNAFATITGDRPFALAEPGARFNATDVIEPGLTRRRLVLAGNCGDRWFIEYEHGGIGLSVAFMVLRSNGDQSVTLIWGLCLKEKAQSLDELRAALNNAAFWDGPNYW